VHCRRLSADRGIAEHTNGFRAANRLGTRRRRVARTHGVDACSAANLRGSEEPFQFFAGRGVRAGAADGHAGRGDRPLHGREHIGMCGLAEGDKKNKRPFSLSRTVSPDQLVVNRGQSHQSWVRSCSFAWILWAKRRPEAAEVDTAWPLARAQARRGWSARGVKPVESGLGIRPLGTEPAAAPVSAAGLGWASARWVRILAITAGSSMAAMIYPGAATIRAACDIDVEDPLSAQARASSCAPVRNTHERDRPSARWLSPLGSERSRHAHLAWGASMPWKRIRCSLGRGTSAGRAAHMNSSGDMTVCVVPSV
jgi:hypothetical protein